MHMLELSTHTGYREHTQYTHTHMLLTWLNSVHTHIGYREHTQYTNSTHTNATEHGY